MGRRIPLRPILPREGAAAERGRTEAFLPMRIFPCPRILVFTREKEKEIDPKGVSALSFLNFLISGVSLGSVYAIIALGYTMVYGIAKMLNFAHGDVIMVGAYICYRSAPMF